jgi:hypothetical protein
VTKSGRRAKNLTLPLADAIGYDLVMKIAYLAPLLFTACSSQPSLEEAASGAPHSHRHVASVDCSRVGWADRVTKEHQAVINDLIAQRDHRVQHALWHAVRSGLDESQTTEVTTAFGAPWGQEHKLCPSPQNDETTASYNPAGEDFLYMHRSMIEMVRAAWSEKGLPCIKGFDGVPDPQQWPLPDATRTGPKSDASLALFKQWDKNLSDPAWLKKVSLSELGFALEFTIHNNLHMRYSTDRPAKQFQAPNPDDDGAVLPYDGNFPADWKFDDPAYNWLADPYGAAVNPVFWKIHGYVDRFIDLWLAANGYRTIAEDCHGDGGCYTWKGKWVGDLPGEDRGPPKLAVPRPAGPGNHRADELRLHHARLAHQRLGVLSPQEFPEDGAKGPLKAAPPEDVLVTARKNVCKGK